jgi:hypothetical protein
MVTLPTMMSSATMVTKSAAMRHGARMPRASSLASARSTSTLSIRKETQAPIATIIGSAIVCSSRKLLRSPFIKTRRPPLALLHFHDVDVDVPLTLALLGWASAPPTQPLRMAAHMVDESPNTVASAPTM